MWAGEFTYEKSSFSRFIGVSLCLKSPKLSFARLKSLHIFEDPGIHSIGSCSTFCILDFWTTTASDMTE